MIVFTLQTVGRCNTSFFILGGNSLFLPCKQQADATYSTIAILRTSLFLPCK